MFIDLSRQMFLRQMSWHQKLWGIIEFVQSAEPSKGPWENGEEMESILLDNSVLLFAVNSCLSLVFQRSVSIHQYERIFLTNISSWLRLNNVKSSVFIQRESPVLLRLCYRLHSSRWCKLTTFFNRDVTCCHLWHQPLKTCFLKVQCEASLLIMNKNEWKDEFNLRKKIGGWIDEWMNGWMGGWFCLMVQLSPSCVYSLVIFIYSIYFWLMNAAIIMSLLHFFSAGKWQVSPPPHQPPLYSCNGSDWQQKYPSSSFFAER